MSVIERGHPFIEWAIGLDHSAITLQNVQCEHAAIKMLCFQGVRFRFRLQTQRQTGYLDRAGCPLHKCGVHSISDLAASISCAPQRRVELAQLSQFLFCDPLKCIANILERHLHFVGATYSVHTHPRAVEGARHRGDQGSTSPARSCSLAGGLLPDLLPGSSVKRIREINQNTFCCSTPTHF